MTEIEKVVAQMVERQLCTELTARRILDSVLNTFPKPKQYQTRALNTELAHLCELKRKESQVHPRLNI